MWVLLATVASAQTSFDEAARAAYLGSLPRSSAVDIQTEVHRWPGGARVRVRPEVDGLEVDGASSVVALDPSAAAIRITGPSVSQWRLERGDLSKGRALDIALQRAARLGSGELWAPRIREGAYLVDDRPRHAWRIDLSRRNPVATYTMWVDAINGGILAVQKTSHSAEALVFENSPLDGTPVVVELEDLLGSSELRGLYSDAYSCAEWTLSDSLFAVNRCDRKTRYAWQVDGDFFYPPRPGETQDPFTEAMLYHHVSEVGRFFEDRYALAPPQPLTTLANFPLANAFFGDFDGNGVGDLSFGFEGDTNFGYDADVVYHEYGHWVVGRIADVPSLGADELGLDWVGGSLNEGAADIFSMVLTGNPQLGGYAGLAFREGPIRDLDADRRCPDDLRGEVHRDGEILASLGWNLIEAVGPERAADLTYGAVGSWGPDVDWSQAGQSFVDAANDLRSVALLTEADHQIVLEVIEASGMVGCTRIVPLEGQEVDPFIVSAGLEGDLYRLPGGQQFRFDLPEGMSKVVIEVTDTRGDEGLGWTVLVRRGEPVGHVPTELAAFGLGFAVPETYDWLVDGAGAGERIVLGPDSDPPLVPGEPFFIAVAGRDLGSIEVLDFTMGQMKLEVGGERAPPVYRGCDCATGKLGGGGTAVFWVSLLIALTACKRPAGTGDSDGVATVPALP